MNITKLAIDNNRTTWVLFAALMLFGISVYQSMPRDYDPGFIIRSAQVVTYFPGASPERVEQLVTDKLEKVIQEIPELDFVSSESRTGVSIVTANIKESYKEMRPIWDNLRRKIDAAKADLPEEAQAPIVNDEFGDVYGIVIGLTAEGFSYSELEEIAEQSKDELLRLPEAAKVDILGTQEQQVFVEYDNARLTELGLSPAQLSAQLADRNIVVPGGAINLGSERISLEPTGNFESVEEIRKTIIQIPGSDQVQYLEDIATVSRGYVDPTKSKISVSGQQALVISISMREGGNNILLGQQTLETLERLTSVYPIGVDFELINFVSDEVEAKVNDFSSNLVQAIVVVSLVMLFSLGFRTGLIVAALIPSSMVAAIFFMSVFDIGIDQISLAALIIALGMLVDNGIVISESIMVKMSRGKAAIDAAIDSANELKVSLLTSSLTTSAAFLPIFLAESATGEYTASLFKVVTITLLSSWVLSMTIIPLLCVKFLRVDAASGDSYNTAFYKIYRRVLQTLVAKKWAALAGTVAVFYIALQGLAYVPQMFFPPSDRTYFKVELELPIGTRIETTEHMVKQFEDYIESELMVSETQAQGVTSWVSYIGSAGPRFVLTHSPKPASSNYSLLIVNVNDYHVIDELMPKIEAFGFNHFPDLLIKLRKIENGSPIANPVEVRLSGRDAELLFIYVDEVKAKMAEMDGLKSISDNWGVPIKKLLVKINQTRARRAGVSSKDIAISLQTGLSGLELTQYREGDDVIPVTMRSFAADRQDIGKLEALAVYSQANGVSVPLRQVADIEVVWQPAKILRRDRLKTVTIGAQIDDNITAAQAFAELQPWLDDRLQAWQFGYDYKFGGEAETSGKANQSIADKLPIALFIIIILLVGQFNSVRKSVIVMTSIPLGLIGVTVGLLVGQSFFGFMTLLGIISLAGIVINNAIVLLERIEIEIKQGLAPAQAIIEAAQQRARPIILTTATTVFGLIPLYVSGGEMWEPMALAIMGGLIFSTILTLCIVPVLYAVLFRVKANYR